MVKLQNHISRAYDASSYLKNNNKFLLPICIACM